MTRDELVEKVARTICIDNGELPDTETKYHPTVSHLWQHYIPTATSCLSVIREALKEPSEGMIVASDLPDYRAVELWHALLSASPLSDKGESR